MGFLDFFKTFSSSSESKIQKAVDLAKNPKAIRDDRWAALEFLAEDLNDVEKAVKALLQRFEFSLEHGINDVREKEKAMAGIVRHGDLALPLVIEHLKNTTRIAWPIKILKALGKTDDHVIECLISALVFDDVSFDQAKTDKNYDILCHLTDYKKAGLGEKVIHFLKDPDERVRHAATEVLLEQDLSEVGPLLETIMRDENPDNSRLQQTVVRKYLEEQWSLTNPGVFNNRHVVGPVYINSSNKLFVQQ